MKSGSLVVVGTGIRLVGQTTLEALACIQRAEKLLYLVTDRATETWLRRLNSRATTLEDCYAEGKPRGQTYHEMADRIVSEVRSGRRVCAVFYGHPGVFVNPSHEAIRRARQEGFPARMLPGISAEACLFADLGLNPGDRGIQSFEATHFLAYRRRFDPSSELILWQVGVLGEPSVRKEMSARRERVQVLTDTLRRHYAARHSVVLYEAPIFPICDPTIDRLPLKELPERTILPAMTLYVPARPSRQPDRKITQWYAVR